MHWSELLVEEAAGCKRRVGLHVFDAIEPSAVVACLRASHIKFERRRSLELVLGLSLFLLLMAILVLLIQHFVGFRLRPHLVNLVVVYAVIFVDELTDSGTSINFLQFDNFIIIVL